MEDLLSCGEVFAAAEARGEPIFNEPREEASHVGLAQMLSMVLDPMVEQFGRHRIQLTSAFRSWDLVCAIRREARSLGTTPRISPLHDQHCASELKPSGERICRRSGAAIDLRIVGLSALQLAHWIADEVAFDRLYIYGEALPVHVSVSDTPAAKIYELKQAGRRLLPRPLRLE